jgi:hypothetical protein
MDHIRLTVVGCWCGAAKPRRTNKLQIRFGLAETCLRDGTGCGGAAWTALTNNMKEDL